MATLIFGGAFDPPHIEHINMVKASVAALDNIDRAVIVPTNFPPHKDQSFLSFKQRAELCAIAFKDVGVPVTVDALESESETENYSYKILPRLKEKYGEIVFLIGGDSAARFGEWKNPDKIAECCPIIVAGRHGFTPSDDAVKELTEKFGGNFIPIDFDGGNVSSSVVRAKLLMGLAPDELPKEVTAYIRGHKLFNGYADKVKKLRCIQSPSLFLHSEYVVIKAVELNARHNLKQQFDKVFLAALLHDNAKERLSLDGFPVPADSIESPVLHQFLGAEKAKRDFGVTDDEVLDAIRYHTTAKANMNMLEKLIYTADSLSDDRTYEPIPEIRKIASYDFERAFKSVLRYTYLKVTAKGKGIYKLTEEAKNYYLK